MPVKPAAPAIRVLRRSNTEARGYATPCRIFNGTTNWGGYGHVTTGTKAQGNRRTSIVHRVVYEHCYGPIPDHLQIDHLCRIRACCEPLHLEAVTKLENVRRGIGAQVA